MEKQDIRARAKLRDIKRLKAIIGMMEAGEIPSNPQRIERARKDVKKMILDYQEYYVR